VIPQQTRRRQRPDSARAQKREETKAALLAAGRALFSTRPYDEVSVSDIGAAAGVSTSLINLHFGSKAGLLFALVAENNAAQGAAARAAAAEGRTALDRLARVVEVCAENALRNPGMMAARMAFSWTWPESFEAVFKTERKPLDDLLSEIVAAGIASGELRPVPIERALLMIWNLYVLGLRPAIHDGWSAAQCAAEVVAQIRAALAA
jgi:AcrR family transcriptional regulator